MGKKLRMRQKLRRRDGEEEMSRLEGLCKDVVVDILLRLRLDVKTVSRCRCVSRTLNQAISDPRFIDMHRDQSMLSKPKILFIDSWVLLKSQADPSSAWTFSKADHTEMDSEGRRKGGGIIGYTNSIRLAGTAHVYAASCDLLCLQAGREIHLCNPRTGQLHTLPKRPHPSSGEEVCFGYLASKREYIVVVLIRERIYDGGGKEVAKFTRGSKLKFSCGSDGGIRSSSWKDIEDVCPYNPLRGILIDNFMYWVIGSSGGEGSSDKFILSLDLDKDKFGTINRPPNSTFLSNPPKLCHYPIALIDLKGSPCVVDMETLSRCNVLELWAFKYNSCWVKELNIKLDFKLPKTLPFIAAKSSRDGDLIMESPVSGKYYLFNVEKKTVRNLFSPHPIGSMTYLPPLGLLRSPFHKHALFYWESSLSFES